MRKFIFFATFIILSITSRGQMQQFKYHPLTEFATDTLGFLSVITGQNEYFDGKPIEMLFKILDKETPVISIVYSGTSPSVQYIEFILDHRENYKLFDQLHFASSSFERTYSESDFKELFGAEPNVIIPLTPALRKKLGQIKFMAKPGIMIFSLFKVPDPSTLPQEMIQPFENVE